MTWQVAGPCSLNTWDAFDQLTKDSEKNLNIDMVASLFRSTFPHICAFGSPQKITTNQQPSSKQKNFWQAQGKGKAAHWSSRNSRARLGSFPPHVATSPSTGLKVERLSRSQFRKTLLHWQQLIGVRLVSRFLIKNNPQYTTLGNSSINQNAKFMFRLRMKLTCLIRDRASTE